MSTEDSNPADETRSESEKREFPPVPEEAIVKPDEERPLKSQIRPEEKLRDNETMKRTLIILIQNLRIWTATVRLIGILLLGPAARKKLPHY